MTPAVLEPSSRYLYIDALRPPPGYRFDCAVVTTYSLDLIALLAAPLAFTAFGWRQEANGLGSDPLPALDALRRHIDRIAVFCQRGQIKVPAKYQPLFDFLEGTVHEVSLPEGRGVFHPKVWLLRYIDAEGAGRPVRYRFICLSRNLTFDTHWDTVLALDGELIERRNAFSRNHPLGDFIAALPGLHGTPLPAGTQGVVDLLQDEVRRVAFEAPPPFADLTFHPLGLGRRASWPFPENHRERLVMSPFIASQFLERFASQGGDHVLISRADELAAVDPARLSGYGQLYELDDAAEPEDKDPETTDASVETVEGSSLHGLHAKFFVVHDGKAARIWTGSANATNAAFNGNVEFLVELVAGRWTAGIEKILGDEGTKTGLRTLLRPVDEAELLEYVGEARPAEDLADLARSSVVSWALKAAVAPGGQEGSYSVSVSADEVPVPPEGVSVDVRPLSLLRSQAVPVETKTGELARFENVSYEQLTSFFVFHLRAKAQGQSATTAFVLNLPLDGAPEGRLEAVLGKLLSRKADFLRFLLLLLAESGLDIPAWLAQPHAGERAGEAFRGILGSGQGLLELLLRALARDPDKLRMVSEVVADLRAGGHGDDFLPDGFEAVWDAIWSVGAEEVQQ